MLAMLLLLSKRLGQLVHSVKGKKLKKVITYGTFDLLHVGHVRLLNRAREFGDHLTVGISTDEFNWDAKRKTCVIPFTDREYLISNLTNVDVTIGETSWDQKVHDIIKQEIDIFVMGDDWKGKFDELKKYCEVVYLPRTENISSSELKSFIKTSSPLNGNFVDAMAAS